MEKVVISFYKELYDLRKDHVYMRVEGLDETALKLFSLKPEERNDELVKIMKERGTIVQIDRQIAEANECVEVFPPREVHPRIEKKAEEVKSKEQVGLICERTYRKISEQMAEFLKEGLVNEKELRIWFPVLFKNVEILEEMIDEESAAGRYSRVEDLCEQMLVQYNNIFDSTRQRISKLQRTRKDVLDKVLNFLETVPKQKVKKPDFDFDDDMPIIPAKRLEDDFFADIPLQEKKDDDDVFGLMS